MIRTDPVPRAEQVGSLKRSPRLIAVNEALYAPGHVAIEEQESGAAPRALRDRRQEARAAVQRQIDIGLDVVTDGEFRRYMFLNSLFRRIVGSPANIQSEFKPPTHGDRVEHAVRGQSTHAGGQPGRAGSTFLSDLPESSFKITFPAESFLALPYKFKPGSRTRLLVAPRARGNRCEPRKTMIKDVVAAGCRYVQLDSAIYLSSAIGIGARGEA